MLMSGALEANWITRFAASDYIRNAAPEYWIDIDALDTETPVMSLDEFIQ